MAISNHTARILFTIAVILLLPALAGAISDNLCKKLPSSNSPSYQKALRQCLQLKISAGKTLNAEQELITKFLGRGLALVRAAGLFDSCTLNSASLDRNAVHDEASEFLTALLPLFDRNKDGALKISEIERAVLKLIKNEMSSLNSQNGVGKKLQASFIGRYSAAFKNRQILRNISEQFAPEHAFNGFITAYSVFRKVFISLFPDGINLQTFDQLLDVIDQNIDGSLSCIERENFSNLAHLTKTVQRLNSKKNAVEVYLKRWFEKHQHNPTPTPLATATSTTEATPTSIVTPTATFTITATATPTQIAGPPVISNVTVTNVSSSGVSINWKTDRPSDSQIEYSTNLSFANSTTLDATLVTTHTVTLTGLIASTTYNYRIKTRSGSGDLKTSENLVFTTSAAAINGTQSTPGTIKSYSTTESIGVEWPLVGDTDHDAHASIEYREAGTSIWLAGMPLLRVDFQGSNMLAGSLFFLKPATTYELRLILSDPDGGASTQMVNVTTRTLPAQVAGRILHVVPNVANAAAGSGTAASPFNGLNIAQQQAQPGDTFLLHTGTYGEFTFSKPGDVLNGVTRYIVWKAAGDGEVLFNAANRAIVVSTNYLWFEGLTLKRPSNLPKAGDADSVGLITSGSPSHIVVKRNHIENYNYQIWLRETSSDWYISDNRLIGDEPGLRDDWSNGEGVELNHSSNHVVEHNTISNGSDGVSYPGTNVIIRGNRIFDMSDDCVENDFGLPNVGVIENHCQSIGSNIFSFQPQMGAPWYFIRNHVVGFGEAILKYKDVDTQPDRNVFINNTFVGWDDLSSLNNFKYYTRAFSRNNLWILRQNSGLIWNIASAPTDWRTDINYDAFDMSGSVTYPSGTEGKSIRFTKASCLAQDITQVLPFNIELHRPTATTFAASNITLKAGCNAIDAGQAVPNITDGYLGAAPDMGAHEFGKTPPIYGVRP